MTSELSGSLLTRALLDRMPAEWLPLTRLNRSVAKRLMSSGLYDSVNVELDVRPAAEGGSQRLDRETGLALSKVWESLGQRRPAVVELLGDTEAWVPTSHLVVVLREEREDTGWRNLAVWDPRLGTSPVRLRVGQIDGVWTLGHEGDRAYPRPRGLRWCGVGRTAPPLRGLRRLMPWLPWRWLWRLRRRWALRRWRLGALKSLHRVNALLDDPSTR